MRSVRVITSVMIATLIFLGVAALPAAGTSPDVSAAAAYRPDGRIRLEKVERSDGYTQVYSKPWLGNNIYNATADNQTAKAILQGSAFNGWYRWTFGVSAQNDGTNSDRFRVHATGLGLTGWKVKYFHGSTDITADVVAGTFTTPTVAPGEQYLIKARVKANFDNGAVLGALRRLVTLTSTNNPDKSDTVRLVVKIKGCGC
jgi:hypothetical protein